MRRGTAVLWTALVVVAAGLVWLGWLNRDRFAPVDIGSRAPDFTLPDLAGRQISLSDLRGRVVLLNLWATWCPPCVEEMPSLQQLQDRLGAEGLSVVAISVDAAPGTPGPFGEPGGDVEAFAREFGIEFTILLDPAAGVQRRYNVTGLPTTFLIDREGRVVERVLGARDWDSAPMAARIRQLLEG
jgi:peroxiredoxin